MDLKFFKKNLIDYLFLPFLIISFYLYLNENRQGLFGYYVIIFAVLVVLKFSKEGFINLCSLSLGQEHKKISFVSFMLLIVSSIITSNIISFIIQSKFLNEHYTTKNYFDYNFLYVFFIFNTVRIFGEELIFRGFLLIEDIRMNKSVFWWLNLLQAIMFSLIHSFFVEELSSKLVFTSYVFLFSIFAGWINKKYNSLLPSWIIHWANGILNFLYVF
ncbi:MAG TPA: hypothetical protein DCG75_06585 [Bacteroidales bacterium]|nr:hypothetical protein [Bacteroidales bacterium]